MSIFPLDVVPFTLIVILFAIIFVIYPFFYTWLMEWSFISIHSKDGMHLIDEFSKTTLGTVGVALEHRHYVKLHQDGLYSQRDFSRMDYWNAQGIYWGFGYRREYCICINKL